MYAQLQYFDLLEFLFNNLPGIDKLVLLMVNSESGKNIAFFSYTAECIY